MDKSSRLTIRLGADARTYLQSEAAKRGLDEAAFARMLIYERMNGAPQEAGRYGAVGRRHLHAAPAQLPPGADGQFVAEPLDQAVSYSEVDGALEERLAGEERAEELEVPADSDGGDPYALARVDALMEAGPTFFDDLMSRMQPRDPGVAVQAPRQAQRQYQPRTYRPAMRQGLQPNYGPGSKTRAIGVNPQVGAGNIQGDGRGNVLRDNFAHFGMVGTRSRA